MDLLGVSGKCAHNTPLRPTPSPGKSLLGPILCPPAGGAAGEGTLIMLLYTWPTFVVGNLLILKYNDLKKNVAIANMLAKLVAGTVSSCEHMRLDHLFTFIPVPLLVYLFKLSFATWNVLNWALKLGGLRCKTAFFQLVVRVFVLIRHFSFIV